MFSCVNEVFLAGNKNMNTNSVNSAHTQNRLSTTSRSCPTEDSVAIAGIGRMLLEAEICGRLGSYSCVVQNGIEHAEDLG